MANSGGLHNLLLTLHEQGPAHREALISRLGKHIRPEAAVHAFNVAAKLKAAQRQSDIDNLDKRVRAGKRIVLNRSLYIAHKLGYVTENEDGDVAITTSGFDKLIKDVPHRLELPMFADKTLGLIVDRIKLKLRDKRNRNNCTINIGLLEALQVIQQTVRGG